MQPKSAVVVAIIGAVVATASLSAMAFNASHSIPQAGPTVAGWDISQIGNGLLALLGGSAGVWGLIKSLATSISPTLGKVIASDEIGQFVPQIPAFIALLKGGTGTTVDIDVNEKLGSSGLTLTGKLKLSREAPK